MTMDDKDRRIILSCFANGFEFKKHLAEINTLDGVETYPIEYMNQLAEMLCEALDKYMEVKE